ncbi:MAG TPA: cytochrome b/b6 domain-containing protein [Rhodanobacteraceae bacterium]
MHANVEVRIMAVQRSDKMWSSPLRTIHLLLAIAITAQLFIGSFMRDPHPGRADSFGFMCHEVIGASILVLLILHWAWTLTHPNEGVRHLFPWSRDGMARVIAELWQAIRYQRLPAGGPENRGLVGFVHGLGILAVSVTVLLGGSFFLTRLAGGNILARVLIKNVHDVFAVIVWVYWGGHLAAVIAHSLLRQPVWRPMLLIGRRLDPIAEPSAAPNVDMRH